MQMKKYEHCKQQIRLAIDAGYPNSSIDKLMKRLYTCDEAIRARSPTSDAGVKKEPCSSEDSQFMSESIEIRGNSLSGGGREVRATNDIPAGAILLRELPFSFTLHPPYYSDYCYYCVQRIDHEAASTFDYRNSHKRMQLMVPCFSCTQIKFCSVECRQAAWTGSHGKECHFLDLLQEIDQNMYSPLITLRALLMLGIEQLLLESKGNNSNDLEISSKIEKMQNECEDKAERESETIATSAPRLRVGYENFNSLVFHPEIPDDKCQEISAFILSFLMHVNNMKIRDAATIVGSKSPATKPEAEVPNSDNSESSMTINQLLWIRNTISKHVRACQVNSMHITDRRMHKDGEGMGVDKRIPMLREDRIGCGVFLTLACINHSCDPNATVVLFNGAQLTLRTTRQIKQGEEISISYGLHYKYHSRAYRRQELSNSYFFTCCCSACESQREPVLNALKCPQSSCDGAVIALNSEHSDNKTEAEPLENDSIHDIDGEKEWICLKCKQQVDRNEKRKMVGKVEQGNQLLAQGMHSLFQSSTAASPEEKNERSSQAVQMLLSSYSLLPAVLYPSNVKLAILGENLSFSFKTMQQFDQAVWHATLCYEHTRNGMDEQINVFNSLYKLVDSYRFLLLSIRSRQEANSPGETDKKTIVASAERYLDEFDSLVTMLLPVHSYEFEYYRQQEGLVRALTLDE